MRCLNPWIPACAGMTGGAHCLDVQLRSGLDTRGSVAPRTADGV